MAWPEHRGEALIQALTMPRVLCLGAIFGAGALAIKIVDRFATTGDPMWLGAPAWSYGVMASLLLLSYFMFEWGYREWMKSRPKIAVAFSNDGCVVQTPEKTKIIANGELVEIENQAVYVRFRVGATSKVAARHSAAYLSKLEKRVVGGSFQPINLHGSIPLWWSHLGPVDIDIPPMVDRYVDVAKISNGDNRLTLTGGYPLTLRKAFDDYTAYRFSCVVVSEGVSTPITIEVEWNGVWDRIIVKEVK